ncbi:cytochrome P450 [Favolaschia claudopus]|uniref:Cytochrome P450 n=1 Tax=Favolaschia claudopus TaxID=2862362 RepID=A0AAW0BSV6_9AGAR
MTLLDLVVALWPSYSVLKKKFPLPPGPTGYPLIGNVFDMPSSQAWRTFAEWGEKYGGIVSVTLLRQPYIIINDSAIATSVLGGGGNAYADRPTFEMANICGWDRVLSRFREYRKLIGRVIGSRVSMEKFHDMEEYHANMLLKRVLEDPEAFESAIRKSMGALILQLAYGYRIKENGSDPIVDLVDRGMRQFSDAMRPGKFLVDVLPILKYIPSWFVRRLLYMPFIPRVNYLRFPGAGFQHSQEVSPYMYGGSRYPPYLSFKEQIVCIQSESQSSAGSRKSRQSYTADLLSQPNLSEEQYLNIKWSAASFIWAEQILQYPLVIAYFLAATKPEMDRVVGGARLPTLDDRASLPYTEALCHELRRWLTIVPLGHPHRAMQDDVNAIVIPNVWQFMHDPAVYRKPFLCMHLADVSIWICVAKAVAGLTISRALDENGAPIDPIVDITDGIVSCTVKPRSEQVLEWIEEATRATT